MKAVTIWAENYLPKPKHDNAGPLDSFFGENPFRVGLGTFVTTRGTTANVGAYNIANLQLSGQGLTKDDISDLVERIVTERLAKNGT
jgi:hypothetical protein